MARVVGSTGEVGESRRLGSRSVARSIFVILMDEFVAQGLTEGSWMVQGALGACRDDSVSKPVSWAKLQTVIASGVHLLEKMIYEKCSEGLLICLAS
ncbi:hypothetical protein CRG98_026547 [Punica granatum]|uniref:Uncharacterized protein n=1 Tax=Punica granatum TaxID=22663 RepID=A0A2I0JBQ7_PUNGR|nr:hypothetical protein CRG98_026547 [Punica granatum]